MRIKHLDNNKKSYFSCLRIKGGLTTFYIVINNIDVKFIKPFISRQILQSFIICILSLTIRSASLSSAACFLPTLPIITFTILHSLMSHRAKMLHSGWMRLSLVKSIQMNWRFTTNLVYLIVPSHVQQLISPHGLHLWEKPSVQMYVN